MSSKKSTYAVMLFVDTIMDHNRFLFVKAGSNRQLPQEILIAQPSGNEPSQALAWFQESARNNGFKDILGNTFDNPKTFTVEFRDFSFIVFAVKASEELHSLLGGNSNYSWLEEDDMHLRASMHSIGDLLILAEYKRRESLLI